MRRYCNKTYLHTCLWQIYLKNNHLAVYTTKNECKLILPFRKTKTCIWQVCFSKVTQTLIWFQVLTFCCYYKYSRNVKYNIIFSLKIQFPETLRECLNASTSIWSKAKQLTIYHHIIKKWKTAILFLEPDVSVFFVWRWWSWNLWLLPILTFICRWNKMNWCNHYFYFTYITQCVAISILAISIF